MQILSIVLLILLVSWSLFWMGYSLWTAARMGHRRWFIVLMVVHTLGVLDIIYLHFIAKKNFKDIGLIFKTKI